MIRNRKSEANANRVIGVVRCSTEEQHLGPDAQREAIARWCEQNGAELVAVFEDLGVSGGAPLEKRPGLLAAIEALSSQNAGVLLAMKRDRIARDVMISAMVERLVERVGARVLTTDGAGNGDGPEAMLMRGMVDLFAQYERALICSRTASALAVKKSRQERTGEIPFGYKLSNDGVHIERDTEEQSVMALIQELRSKGLSIRAIAEKLNSSGCPSRGTSWHPTTISRLLNRAA